MTPWVLIGIAVILVVFVITVYNRLVNLKNRVRNSFAQIDVQLQRRHDLVPDLVETARACMRQERETLTRVIEARNQAESAREAARNKPDDGNAMAELGKAESMLSGSLAHFFALSENYPKLKADETMSQLMEQLTSTENRASFARQAFNDAVMNYNTYREQFPNSIVANLLGNFQEAELLRIENPEARKRVDVSF